MKLLLIDNYDSFAYNLVYAFRELGADVTVLRNDRFTLSELEPFENIVISPGPGLPSEAGKIHEVLETYGSTKRIFGVCLGHQAIGEVYGAELENMGEVDHGKELLTRVLVPEDPLFAGVPELFPSGRYHSWLIRRASLPSCLKLLAEDEAGRVMAIRHQEHDVVGVQFHPESILTAVGNQLLGNWLAAEEGQ